MTEDHRSDHPGEWDCDDSDLFEKIRKHARPVLPTAANRRARRSAKETAGSKRVRKSVSSRGGIHRRRQKKIL
jgi:hypothetical protein